MNVDWAPGDRQPSDQASRLGLWVRRKLAAIIYIHLAIVIITQPVGWYSFYRPTNGRRLSRPKHCSKGAQPVLKTVYRSSCHDKHNCQRLDSNLDPLTPQSDALTTRLLRPALWFQCFFYVTKGVTWSLYVLKSPLIFKPTNHCVVLLCCDTTDCIVNRAWYQDLDVCLRTMAVSLGVKRCP